ncbi:MAG: type II secretion system protein N, partial [Arenimonas sp.]
FGLRLGYDVALGVGAPTFPLTIFFSRIEVANAAISLPVPALAEAMPKLGPYRLSGEVQVQIASLSISSGATRGSATLQWRGASSALAPVSPLGDYQLRFEADGTQVRSTLLTLQGPLQLDGHGDWPMGSKPQFFASAQMQPQYRQQLAPFLRLISVERRDGSFEWRLQ